MLDPPAGLKMAECLLVKLSQVRDGALGSGTVNTFQYDRGGGNS